VVTGPNETGEILAGDILEETPIVPFVASVLPPAMAPPRRAHRLPPPAPQSIFPWVAGGAAIGLLVSLGIAVAVRIVDARTPYPRTSVTVVQTTTRAAASPTPAPSSSVTSVRVDALPAVSSTRGTLRFSPRARGHRVFLDGVVIGQSDAPLDVRCGRHSLQIGSRGEARMVDVPCGGALDLP
jgi:hypothetical protein